MDCRFNEPGHSVPADLLAITWCGPPTQNANTLVTVELKSISGGTELTLTHEKLPTAELRAAHEIGWANMFDHLADVVD
jgi:uncharacterized protein YndB with AHSA1/START domain